MFFRTFLLLATTSQLIAYNYPSETILKQWYTNKKVLVTGGYGFIGSHIVEKLIQLGAHKYVVII